MMIDQLPLPWTRKHFNITRLHLHLMINVYDNVFPFLHCTNSNMNKF